MKVNFQGLEGKVLAKARKIFRQEIARGLSEPQARRNARGEALGKTKRQAQGHRKEELQVKARGTAKGEKTPKSRLDIKKNPWSLYSYNDAVNGSGGKGGIYFGMTTYDLTKTRKYNSDALFAMHQYFERKIQAALKMGLNLSQQEEIQIEEHSEEKSKHRKFMFQLTDFETGEIVYGLIYSKGEIIKRKMWEDFDYVQFKFEIREQRIWE